MSMWYDYDYGGGEDVIHDWQNFLNVCRIIALYRSGPLIYLLVKVFGLGSFG